MARTQKEIDNRFDIMGLRRRATILSAVLLFISVAALALRGLNFGIDFTGGYVIEAGFDQPADLGAIRQQLGSSGFGDAIVQHFGSASEGWPAGW